MFAVENPMHVRDPEKKNASVKKWKRSKGKSENKKNVLKRKRGSKALYVFDEWKYRNAPQPSIVRKKKLVR